MRFLGAVNNRHLVIFLPGLASPFLFLIDSQVMGEQPHAPIMCVGRTAPMHVRQGEHPLPTQLMGEQPHVLCIVCGEQPSHYSDSCFISEQPYVSIAIVWGEQPPHNILASKLSLPKLW